MHQITFPVCSYTSRRTIKTVQIWIMSYNEIPCYCLKLEKSSEWKLHLIVKQRKKKFLNWGRKLNRPESKQKPVTETNLGIPMAITKLGCIASWCCWMCNAR